MIYLKVIQSNIPKRKKEVVTFEVAEDFLRRQLDEQGYVLIKKSDKDNPEAVVRPYTPMAIRLRKRKDT